MARLHITVNYSYREYRDREVIVEAASVADVTEAMVIAAGFADFTESDELQIDDWAVDE